MRRVLEDYFLIRYSDEDLHLRERKQVFHWACFATVILGLMAGLLSDYEATDGLVAQLDPIRVYFPLIYIIFPFILQRYGYYDQITLLYMGCFVVHTTLALALNGGVTNSMLFYFVSLVIAGFLLSGVRVGMAVALASVVVAVWLYSIGDMLPAFAYAEQSREAALWNLRVFIVMVVSTCFAIMIYHHFAQHTARSLERALKEASAARQELEDHRDQLAAIVADRTRELAAQNLKLQQSLVAEKELNELQTQFVSMASHEFRTPLAIIDGTARRVAKLATKRDELEFVDKAETIRKTVSRMTMLVERTLDSSKLASGKIALNPSVFDLKSLVVTVIERHRELNPDFTVTLDIESCTGEYFGDEKLMDNVISNIVSNAIKYSADSRHIDVEGSSHDGVTTICVKDYGVGIPASELPKITERFFRATTSTGIQGTGIGLNLVKNLVDLHDGSIDIASEEGEWTEFTLSLPHKSDFSHTIEPEDFGTAGTGAV